AGMRNAFELIKSSLTPDHEHFDLLELIDREIERISGIVHQMYQLYRRTPQQPTELDLAQVVREVIYMLQNTAAKRRVVVHVAEPLDVPRALLVEGEVKQILYNLICNALQASPVDATVEVQIARADQELPIRVADNGSAIDAN